MMDDLLQQYKQKADDLEAALKTKSDQFDAFLLRVGGELQPDGSVRLSSEGFGLWIKRKGTEAMKLQAIENEQLRNSLSAAQAELAEAQSAGKQTRGVAHRLLGENQKLTQSNLALTAENERLKAEIPQTYFLSEPIGCAICQCEMSISDKYQNTDAGRVHEFSSDCAANVGLGYQLLDSKVAELTAENERLQGEKETITNSAIELLYSSACEKHNEMVKGMSFGEFRETAFINKCPACMKEEIEELQGKLSKARQDAIAEKWQPISTAPKETPILLAWADGHVQLQSLRNEEVIWFEEAPTHWQPLPAPPDALATQEVKPTQEDAATKEQSQP